jgi:tRNA(Ile)-lysidine synthase
MSGRSKQYEEMGLQSRFQDHVSSNSLWQEGDLLLLACSGGIDSVVLATLLHGMNQPVEILHCNFNLRGEESTRDEDFVRALAQSMGLSFHVQSFDTKAAIKTMGKGVQEVARILRYDWFEKVMEVRKKANKNTYLLTAHHADDQVETIAMNFFRGTGIAGMHGMLMKSGKLIRPLLFATRADIVEFAASNAIKWVDDSSNVEDNYTRNHFRHHVIPQVEKIFPALTQNLLDNAKRFSEIEIIYIKQIEKIKSGLIEKQGQSLAIPVNKLRAMTPIDTIMFEVFRDFGFSAHQVPEIKKLFDAISGKSVSSITHRVLRNRNWLLIDPMEEKPHDIIVIDEAVESVPFNNCLLQIKKYDGNRVPDEDANHAWIDLRAVTFPLILRPWKPGDYIYPLGMRKKKKVAKLLTDLKLSLAEKENQWVVESDKKIIWVVGRRIDDRFKLSSSSQKIMSIALKNHLKTEV